MTYLRSVEVPNSNGATAGFHAASPDSSMLHGPGGFKCFPAPSQLITAIKLTILYSFVEWPGF